MTNKPTSQANSDKVQVDAICIGCNKRFTSMRSVSMHLKGTANRHAVNFVRNGSIIEGNTSRELTIEN